MHAGFTAAAQPIYEYRDNPKLCSESPDVQVNIDRIVAIWIDCRARFSRDGRFLFGAFSIADAMFASVINRLSAYAVSSYHRQELYDQRYGAASLAAMDL